MGDNQFTSTKSPPYKLGGLRFRVGDPLASSLALQKVKHFTVDTRKGLWFLPHFSGTALYCFNREQLRKVTNTEIWRKTGEMENSNLNFFVFIYLFIQSRQCRISFL